MTRLFINDTIILLMTRFINDTIINDTIMIMIIDKLVPKQKIRDDDNNEFIYVMMTTTNSR